MANHEPGFRESDLPPEYKERMAALFETVFEGVEWLPGSEGNPIASSRSQRWDVNGRRFVAFRTGIRFPGRTEQSESTRVEFTRMSPLGDGYNELRIYWYFVDTGELHVMNELFTDEELEDLQTDGKAREELQQRIARGFDSGLFAPSVEHYMDLQEDVASFQQP